jgi:LacI family transcriptional regulator
MYERNVIWVTTLSMELKQGLTTLSTSTENALLMNVHPARRPTMRDVAQVAGVSLKTVSRVVNAEEGVSEDLVTRVERAVHLLRYRPDERARNLRQSDSRPTSIGFAMVDVANPFFSSIFRGLEEVAREHDCLVFSGSSDGDPARQDKLIETFISRRVDGLVIVPSGDGISVMTEEIIHGTPIVFLDCEPHEHASDLVRSDHFGGAVQITRHLLERGHTRIGFLGDDPRIFSAGLRLDGFRKAMAEAGIPAHEQLILTGHHTPSEWRRLALDWLRDLDPRPTAVVTAQNFVTIGAVQALHELGLHWEIALIGFDEIELSDVVEPGISLIPQQPRELGRRAGELLFRRLNGATDEPVREILTSPIIERGSGEIRPLAC